MQHRWVRFEHAGKAGFGTLEGERRARAPAATCSARPSRPARCSRWPTCKLLTPTQPSKVIALWNNFHALGEKLNLRGAGRAAVPAEVAQLLPRARRDHPQAARATARWCSRASSASSSARPARRCREDAGAGPCVRLHLRQRRDGGRHPEPRRLVRAVGARQGLRHLLPDRARWSPPASTRRRSP